MLQSGKYSICNPARGRPGAMIHTTYNDTPEIARPQRGEVKFL